jgi:hypothetical protein
MVGFLGLTELQVAVNYFLDTSQTTISKIGSKIGEPEGMKPIIVGANY